MDFNTWLETFVEEKQLNREQVLVVEGPSGDNFIPLECLLDEIKNADKKEKKQIKAKIVQIDFANGDVMNFFQHLAQAIAI